MAFNLAPGMTNMGSSGTIGITPIVFSRMSVVKFYDNCVITAIANTDYVGNISAYGDTVVISQLPTVAVDRYIPGQLVTRSDVTYQDSVSLTINKALKWSVILEDVQAKQAHVKIMDMLTTDATEQLKITVDTEILAYLPGEAHASLSGATAGKRGNINLGTTGNPLQTTSANILSTIIGGCTLAANEANLPLNNRFLVAPPWFFSHLKQSELKNVSITGDPTSPLRNGLVGRVDGWDMYSCNHTPVNDADNAYHISFGHKTALTFASQMATVETMRTEAGFANLVKGLFVYGYKVIRPESLGNLYVSKG